jgi:hypothetical protein
VSGANDVGGLVGVNDGGTVTNSFWNTQTSGRSSSAGGTGLTTTQMRDPASFTGWDLNGVWNLHNAARPFLRSFQQPLTATVGNASFTYDATAYAGTPAITYSVAGFTPVGTPVFDYGAEPKNAGTYAINVCCLSTQQYAATVVPGTLTINRAPITVSNITAQNKTYNGNTAATLLTSGATLSGRIGADDLSVSGTGTFDSPNVGASKTVTLSGLSLGGAAMGNYVLATVGQQTSTTASITPAPLTITGATTSTAYTAGTQTNTFTASGLLGTDSVSAVSGRASGTNAGTYLDTLSGATGTGLGNYTISYVNGALTITPAPLAPLPAFMPGAVLNPGDPAQIDIGRLTSMPDAVRLALTSSLVLRLVLPPPPPREQPSLTLPQTSPGL